jgi:hypothetical protein
MAETGSERVLVQVVDVDVAADREITFGRNLAEGLGDRVDDIRGAIEAGSESVAKSLQSLTQGIAAWGRVGFVRDRPYCGGGCDRV